MVGQSRKWMIVVATTWVQAFTGTNFDFAAYSSEMKSVLGISQLQLNYLSVASDMGKVFGWCSGVCLNYLPLPLVLFIAAFMGLAGYLLQWLLIHRLVPSLPYILVFLLCLLAGCSISWFNTVCYVLCIRNFPANRALALSLTISFNGVSAALFTLIANSIDPKDDTLYLLLNAIVPLLTSIAALPAILRQPPLQSLPTEAAGRDSLIFLVLYALAAITGFYLLIFYSLSSTISMARILFFGAIILLAFPLCIPGIVFARDWAHRTVHSNIRLKSSNFNLVESEDLELHKELIANESRQLHKELSTNKSSEVPNITFTGDAASTPKEGGSSCCDMIIEKDQVTVLGEEHSSKDLMLRWDFWLYYLTYFCGGTIGLVYSNNLGQISESLGHRSQKSSIVTIYAACSFFGRLLAAAPDFLRDKLYFARTGWLAAALVPTPFAFFLLAASGSQKVLETSTGLIGLSSGFIFAAAVSITSELFGPNSAGVNHNILITNIPIGSVLYGLLAALVYDSNVMHTGQNVIMEGGKMVCMGRQCYFQTFIWWGCISVLGLISSVLLFLRTKAAYERFERNRYRMQFS